MADRLDGELWRIGQNGRCRAAELAWSKSQLHETYRAPLDILLIHM